MRATSWLASAIAALALVGTARADTIDFSTDGEGNTLSAGDIVDDEFASLGIHVTTHDPVRHPAMIFDSSSPTGGDPDLGAPNRDFGGPGIGSGGGLGAPGENAFPLGNLLIISEDGDTGDPDDNAAGGTLVFTFDFGLRVGRIGLLDIDGNEGGATVTAYDQLGNVIASVPSAPLGNNSFQLIDLGVEDVGRLEIGFPSSGGVASVEVSHSPEPATLALVGAGLAGGALIRRRRRKRGAS